MTGRKRQFASAFDATGSAAEGEVCEKAETLVNRSADPLGRGCIVEANVIDDVLEVGRCVRGPANLHLLSEHLFKTRTDFFVGKELSTVEAVHACCHLLPKPGVVIQVAFNELLDVIIRSTPVFLGNAVKLRLQFRREMDFHQFSA
jgi:hypothetical protein